MAFPKIEGYIVTEKLGSGSYSTVYKAHTKVGGRSVVAIKCVEKARVRGTAADDLLREIRLLKELRHPHVVHMHDFTWDQRNIYIIMEYCCGGDLSKYIRRYGRVPERQVHYFLQQLASALKFLRERGVVHMDLKPHNLLLQRDPDNKRVLKLADFGFAAILESNDAGAGVRGSPLYMAPEMVAGRYDARVDLWSVGVIMYECLFGAAPYRSSTLQQLVAKLAAHAPIEIPRNAAIPPECRDLLTRLLQHDPDQRISYEEFFAHPYLDLEHMPNKENYEKAVQLIKQAIELDSSGSLREAFDQYRAALRLLVPCVAIEPDAVRKGALTAKLTRYMERAEEIQRYLRDPEGTNLQRLPLTVSGHSGPSVPAGTQVPGGPSCCGSVADCHRDLTAYRAANCVKSMSGTRTDTQTGSEVNGGEETGALNCTQNPPLAGPSNEQDVGKQADGKVADGKPHNGFSFRRLFSRSPVPMLGDRDSSIAVETRDSATSDKAAVGKTDSDACRIT